MTRVFGFTLLRNAVKYDYCFKESLLSLQNVCERTYIAIDKGEDSTAESLSDIPNLKLIDSPWDMNNRQGGIVLSQQTNIALEALRADHRATEGSWGFYLQADEVLHEDDRDLILKDIQLAEEMNYDAISFRYLHFWQSHHTIAINKKWYPQEIRAIKLNTSIESWGDAQSFRHHSKVFQSEAHIFHYGHVREEDKYKSKKADILKMYHSDQKMKKYIKREKRFDNQTEVLPYWGPQPHWMKERIEKMGEIWSAPDVEEVTIFGDPELYSSDLKKRIKAHNVFWVDVMSDIEKSQKKNLIVPLPNLWQKIFYPSKVPFKMRSPLALSWNLDFLLTMKLSEKKIGVN